MYGQATGVRRPLSRVEEMAERVTRTGTDRETAVDAAVPWRVRDAALLLVVGLLVLGLTLLGAVGLYHLQGAPTVLPPQPPAILATLATDLFYLTILAGVWMLVVRR